MRLLTILFTLLTLNLFAQINRIEYSQPDGTLHYIDVPVVTSILPSVTISNLIPNTLYEFKVRGRCYVSPTYKSGAFSTVSTYATAMRIEFEPLEQNQPFVIYNLLGKIVYTGTRIPYNLIPGSYIVTKGNTIKKVVVID